LILFCSKQHLSTAAPLQGQKDEGSESKGINQEYYYLCLYSETWVNRNPVHSDLNFKSPDFSVIIFVKNHWINRTLHILYSALTCGPNTLITFMFYLRKPVMFRSINRVFTYMWISIGSKIERASEGKRIESVYRSVYISTPVISDHW
jgi:hypothetical protein